MRTPQLAAALLLAACKVDVEGEWGGLIDGEPATLELEQRGSTLEGELCSRRGCQQVRGDLEDFNVHLFCHGCEPALELDLTLDEGGLVGEAFDPSCACPLDDETCDCTLEVSLQRCDQACDR